MDSLLADLNDWEMVAEQQDQELRQAASEGGGEADRPGIRRGVDPNVKPKEPEFIPMEKTSKPEVVHASKEPGTGARHTYDNYQKKWDKWDNAEFIEDVLTEEAKKEQWKSVMTVLGADVAIAWERRCARYSVSKDKAVRWSKDLKQALQEGTLTPDRAEKYAGRLGFATNVMGDKVGRAFIKPFFMQAYCPTFNFIMSPLLKEALMRWIEYLEVMPTIERHMNNENRPEMTLWTDAAGASQMCSSVVDRHRVRLDDGQVPEPHLLPVPRQARRPNFVAGGTGNCFGKQDF